MGIATSLAVHPVAFWEALLGQKSGVGEVTRFDTSWLPVHIAAEIKDLPRLGHVRENERLSLGPAGQVLLACSRQALQAANLLAADGTAAEPGLDFLVGTIHGELNEHIRQCKQAWETHDERSSQILSRQIFKDNVSFAFLRQTAHYLGLTGFQSLDTNACAASGYAICQAAERIRQGQCDLAVAGGVDVLAEADYVGFCSLRALAPERCQPFAPQRKGLVIGEGGGMLVLESGESMRRRQQPPIAQFLGYGWSNDAYHLSAPHPQARGTIRSLEQALADAGVLPQDVGCIVAHGTGTLWNDKMEAQAIREVFGADPPPVTAPKASVGHCMGAASVVEAIAGILSLVKGVVPPTQAHSVTDPECPVDVVSGAGRPLAKHICLTNSAAFGGNNDSLIFSLPGRNKEQHV